MYNAIKLFVISLFVIAISTSCSNSKERNEAARELLAEAEDMRDCHDYEAAIALLDSVDRAYRDCIAERKNGTKIRIQTLIDLSTDSLQLGESRRESRQKMIDSLSSKFITVSMPGTRGYRTIKAVFTGNEMSGSFIQARIDENDYFTLVINNAGKRINLTGIEYGINAATGKSVYMEGSEMMSLRQETVQGLVNAVTNVGVGPISIELVGEKGRTSIKLTGRDIQAWRDTWLYSMLLQEKRHDDINYEKYLAAIEKLQGQLDALNAEESTKE